MDPTASRQVAELSKRAQTLAVPDTTNPIWEVLNNQWDPKSNPEGYVSLGVAENRLMHKELQEGARRHMEVPQYAFTYGDGPMGSKKLRAVLARFINRNFKSIRPVQASHIAITNGCSHAIEHCSWTIANPGDGFLLGQPHYVAFIPDISLRPGVEVVKVQFGDTDPMSVEAVANYEKAILQAKEKGIIVRGLMLCSPHNPLGRCYSKDALIAYLKLCQKYRIHLVSDEIYALSVWKNKEDQNPPPVDFTSVLSIELDGLIDPDFVHVLWGVSKDFGANGLRLGAVISRDNPAFLQAVGSLSIYSFPSSISDHIMANILDDDIWTDRYIKTNRERLSDAYSFVVNFLRQNKVSYAPGANAAFFLWANLGKAYLERHPERTPKDKTVDITEEVQQALLNHKVFLASGIAFGAETPGLFRIVFSQPRYHVEEGLKRMVQAIDARPISAHKL